MSREQIPGPAEAIPSLPDERWVRDERGVFGITPRSLTVLGVSAVSLTALVSSYAYNSVTADANLNDADTSATVNKIVWKPHEAIDPVAIYPSMTLDARNIDEKVTVKIGTSLIHTPDIMPDPHVNKQLDGVSQEACRIPFRAIRQSIDPKTGKLLMTVDVSKTVCTISWAGAGPKIRNYTISDGKKNFNDQDGFRAALNKVTASDLRLFNMDKLGNTEDALDASINHDMSLKGLQEFGVCNTKPAFKLEFDRLAEAAVRANVAMLGRSSDLESVKITNDKANWHIDTGKAADEAVGETYPHTYSLPEGNWHVDKLNCNLDRQTVEGQ